MKSYILTDHERDVIKKYLEMDVREKSISVYRVRAKRYVPRLREDMDLIEKLLKK